MLASMMYAPSLFALVVGVTRSVVVRSWSHVERDHHCVCPVGALLIHNGYEIKYNTGINSKQIFMVFIAFMFQ